MIHKSRTFTNEFGKVVDSTARGIHILIAESGRQGLNVNIICAAVTILSLKNKPTFYTSSGKEVIPCIEGRHE
jgi:hypothetical protein